MYQSVPCNVVCSNVPYYNGYAEYPYYKLPYLSATHDEKVTIGLYLAALNKQAYDLYNTGSMVLPVWPETTRRSGKLCGATVAKEKTFGFFLESPSSIYLVFRGTQNIDDWLANVTFPLTKFPYVENSGSVELGFFTLYKSIRSSIINSLVSMNGSKTLYITGHSLGGALATMCTLDVAVNSKFKQPVYVSFAAPAAGNQAFVDSFDKTINTSIRVYNRCDIVPKLPPPLAGFRHVKGGLEINVERGSIVGNHSIDTAYFPGLAEKCPECAEQVCKNNPPGFCPVYTIEHDSCK